MAFNSVSNSLIPEIISPFSNTKWKFIASCAVSYLCPSAFLRPRSAFETKINKYVFSLYHPSPSWLRRLYDSLKKYLSQIIPVISKGCRSVLAKKQVQVMCKYLRNKKYHEILINQCKCHQSIDYLSPRGSNSLYDAQS